jgi:hypothetical protein
LIPCSAAASVPASLAEESTSSTATSATQSIASAERPSFEAFLDQEYQLDVPTDFDYIPTEIAVVGTLPLLLQSPSWLAL